MPEREKSGERETQKPSSHHHHAVFVFVVIASLAAFPFVIVYATRDAEHWPEARAAAAAEAASPARSPLPFRSL